MERRIGYCRVSTADQNLDMQIEAMVRYGVPRELVFTDKMSGATSKRPGGVISTEFNNSPLLTASISKGIDASSFPQILKGEIYVW